MDHHLDAYFFREWIPIASPFRRFLVGFTPFACTSEMSAATALFGVENEIPVRRSRASLVRELFAESEIERWFFGTGVGHKDRRYEGAMDSIVRGRGFRRSFE